MIAVLTSGVALGVHVPGLLLARRLAEAGVPVRVDVLERYLPAATRERVPAAKRAFHRDFRLALAGQRLAARNGTAPGEDGTRALLAAWRADGVDLLVVLSGFWLPTAHRYAARRPGTRVHAVHVDSVASPSFTSAASAAPAAGCHQDVWLLQERAGGIARTVPVGPAEPVPWSRREPRHLVHGGGWGMGTYAARAREMRAAGLALDVVAYEAADLPPAGAAGADRHFMIDPDWHPWHDPGFPPFGPVGPDGRPAYRRGTAHHESFHLTRRATAVVSKPGGGTLMDSLAAATPVVLLEPFGAHEARNAELWERLGFGLPYEVWRAAGWSRALLEPLHRNLLAARERAESYPLALVEERTR
ncbi:hypothetical protein RKE29_11830 [Streptomyces sp. B1866]|uniref:hypothetical protein n=1 Tax=Streptomyces sp. B1866 TaxID=3075431 RepID=UPI00288CE549|nr:hypothetical protein [Streptomyces sp. B1866]MDT3397329.1 hypothetical protein [Streptomyces sp. B1866]